MVIGSGPLGDDIWYMPNMNAVGLRQEMFAFFKPLFGSTTYIMFATIRCHLNYLGWVPHIDHSCEV